MVIIVRKMYVSLFYMWLVIFFVLHSYAQTPAQSIPLFKESVPEGNIKQYSILPHKFIDLIHGIAKPVPISFGQLQKIFNKKFYIKENSNDLSFYQIEEIITKDGVTVRKVKVETNNNNLQSYRSKNLITEDGVIIKQVEITTGINNKDVIRGIYVDLDQKQCVSSKLLKKEFSFIIPDFLTIPLKSDTSITFTAADTRRKFFLIETMAHLGCTTRIGISNIYDKEEKKEWKEYVHKAVLDIRKNNIQ